MNKEFSPSVTIAPIARSVSTPRFESNFSRTINFNRAPSRVGIITPGNKFRSVSVPDIRNIGRVEQRLSLVSGRSGGSLNREAKVSSLRFIPEKVASKIRFNQERRMIWVRPNFELVRPITPVIPRVEPLKRVEIAKIEDPVQIRETYVALKEAVGEQKAKVLVKQSLEVKLRQIKVKDEKKVEDEDKREEKIFAQRDEQAFYEREQAIIRVIDEVVKVDDEGEEVVVALDVALRMPSQESRKELKSKPLKEHPKKDGSYKELLQEIPGLGSFKSKDEAKRAILKLSSNKPPVKFERTEGFKRVNRKDIKRVFKEYWDNLIEEMKFNATNKLDKRKESF